MQMEMSAGFLKHWYGDGQEIRNWGCEFCGWEKKIRTAHVSLLTYKKELKNVRTKSIK